MFCSQELFYILKIETKKNTMVIYQGRTIQIPISQTKLDMGQQNMQKKLTIKSFDKIY